MQWSPLLALILAVTQASAFLRFSCSQLVIQRFDPLVTPGRVSPHLHQIVGGNAFDIEMKPENDLPALSTCTTCTIKEDLSNYWTAVLFFKHPNGTFERVKQRAPVDLGNVNGGMAVYYIEPFGGKPVTAFKKGFRMMTGDPFLRTINPDDPHVNTLTFRCLSTGGGNSGATPAPGTEFHTLPPGPCAGGVRSQIIFPSCWNGVDLDTPDHKSHVTFTDIESNCPPSHPMHIPMLFLETIWDTTPFNGLWPAGSPNPFVFGMGDPTGAGQHADFIFGWKGDSLQRAMTDPQCLQFGRPCPALTTQSVAQANQCTQPVRVKGESNIDGLLENLPGCNPIQDGPGRAKLAPNDCGATQEFEREGGPVYPVGGARRRGLFEKEIN